LVLEENELLLEQLDVQQQKHKMLTQEGQKLTPVLINYLYFFVRFLSLLKL